MLTTASARAAYTLLWHVLLPWLPLRLWWRGRKEPGYREFIAERFGRYTTSATGPVLWVHAVSLGETHAARPLAERLLNEFPQATLLLTHMTATGRAAGRVFANDRLVQAWLPYDLPRFVDNFLTHFKPAAGMLLETEVWPNLIAGAQRRGIPLFLINARLSAQSARGYARVAALTRSALSALTGVAAQTAQDGARLESLGSPRALITGNVKFDIAPGATAVSSGQMLRERLGRERPVWLAASTRDGEEALLLDALAANSLPQNALTLIVPRHPQRFDAVARELDDRRMRYVRRSSNAPVPAGVSIVLGDSVGEMATYCVAADVVLMGGSLLPLGGQNLIEPLAAGKPTLVGPHMFNFAEATRDAVATGAAWQVGSAGEAIAAVGALLCDAARRERMQAAAGQFMVAHAGATDRLWSWLAPQLHTAMAEAEAGSAATCPR